VGQFPDDDIEVTASLAFGADLTADPSTWTWTDLSSRVIRSDSITISRGVVVGNGTTQTARATGLTVLNDDGWLTPFLPTSPWWPYVDLGTPARISIRTTATPYVTDTFTRTVASGWGTSDNNVAWSLTSGVSVAGGKGVFSAPVANSVRRARANLPLRDAEVVFDASMSAVITGDRVFVGPQLRDDVTSATYLQPSLTFNLGGQIQLAIVTFTASVPSLLTAITVPGLTYTAGTSITCHVRVVGDRIQMRAWLTAGVDPVTWGLDETINGYTDAGVHTHMGLYTPGGVTNTMPITASIDNLSIQQPKYARIEGYITDVRPTFRVTSDGVTHSVAQIDIGGVGSRLERRTADPLSPLRRSLQKATIPPIAYWPLEDKAQSTSGASAFPDQPAMVSNGPVVFAFDLGDTDDDYISEFGSSAVTSVAAGAKLTAPVPSSSATAWTVSAMVRAYTPGIGGGVTEQRLFEWATPSGTFQRWALIGTLAGYVVRAYNDSAGTTTNVVTYTTSFVGMLHLSVTATQSAGNINAQFLINANPLASGSVVATIGPPTRVTINPDQLNTTGSVDPEGIRFIVGHLTVHNAVVVALPYYGDGTYTIRADRAWAYEMAHRRAARIAAEEDIALRLIGSPESDGPTRLNSQQEGAFVDLLTAAVDAESGGLLVEDGFGYLMIDRTARYNAPVDLTVDMGTYRYPAGVNPEDVLVPKLDARGPNVWTVERRNGSAATAAAPAAYRDRRGTVAAKATLDVLYDSDCAPHAGWRVHLNVDGQGANYPQFGIDLAANPTLIDDFLLCRIGSRVQRTNQPTIAGLGVIDQVIDGLTETISPRRDGAAPGWTVTIDGSPASVWQVGVYDTQRWDSSSTTLAADVTSSGTVLGFSTAIKGDAWSTTDSPMSVVVAGQSTQVLWMSGIGSVFAIEGGFETGLTGWTATSMTITQSSTFARTGTYSVQGVVTGSPASAAVVALTASPAVVGSSYTMTAWVYAVSSVPNVRVFVQWHTAGGTFITSTVGSTVTLTGGVWTLFTVSGVAPATTGLARPVVQLSTSPTTGTTIYVDDVDLTLDSVSAGVGPYTQTAYVTRDPVITGALKAGSEIHVADPLWWSL
jgi:hypothetical protein